jgi:transposase
MDAIDQLKEDFRQGRVDVDRLIIVMVSLQQQLESTRQQLESTRQQLESRRQQLEAANRRIEELEKKDGGPSAKTDEAFSMRAEEKRQEKRGGKKLKLSKKGRRGRLTSADKLQVAEDTRKCFPYGVPQEACRFSHARPVWELTEGRAVLVRYDIYRCGNQFGKIPGVLGRSEFSLEIMVQIAYLVYNIGLSFDKVCQLLQFLQKLPMTKTQVDALLRQLARHWQHEFDVLCTLLANSLVVHADETSWSINSVWAFLSEKARLVFFGVHKDGETLKNILDPETFLGLVISDDYAVYANFSNAQKCWAHLLRKAIKLTLQEPNEAKYRNFTDGLLNIYRHACRVQKDKRLSAAGRQRKVEEDLEQEIMELCAPQWDLQSPPLPEGPANDYRLLVHEIMHLMLDNELFTFVTAPPVTKPNRQSEPVSGTNNEAERAERPWAQARDTGRTNKTINGARRQTILVSVLESLRLYLPTFNLDSITNEIQGWWQAGQSCFTRLLRKMKLSNPTESILDKVLPAPDG